MREEVKKHLVNRYNMLEFKTKKTCLKYHYLYSGVNVNVFFDAYDIDSLSLCLILSYEKSYYYTSLNIEDTSIRTEYLEKIPPEILDRILVDSHLVDFYNNMEMHILEDKPYVNFYSKDKIFTNTMKYSRSETDLPFWSHLRNVRMSDDALNRISASASIPYKILLEIQRKNFTLVRTDKPESRKKLTVILKAADITLD